MPIITTTHRNFKDIDTHHIHKHINKADMESESSREYAIIMVNLINLVDMLMNM